jgi:RecA-family ATPase
MNNLKSDNLPKAMKQDVIRRDYELLESQVIASSLRDIIARVKKEPKLKMVYSGIKDKSVGVIFGPSKSGKTMYCENLGMSIAAGAKEYLGLPIDIDNRNVIFLSLEEHYANRTDRKACSGIWR